MALDDKFDVESLIGKSISFINSGGTQKAILAGIAEGIGWTIVAESNTKLELSCWNGPNSPSRTPNTNIEAFEIAWPEVVRMLTEGYYDISVVDNAISGRGMRLGGYTRCAFK